MGDFKLARLGKHMNEEEWLRRQPEWYQKEMDWLESESPESRKNILKNQQAYDPLAAVLNPAYVGSSAIVVAALYFVFGAKTALFVGLLCVASWLSWLFSCYSLERKGKPSTSIEENGR